MNISSLEVKLSGDDLLSIFNEFLSIEELKIEKIEVKDEVRIIGSFKKIITINFEVKFKVIEIVDNQVVAEITGFKVINIGIASFIRKIALKYALKSLSNKGILYLNGKIYIQYKYILKTVPYIDFDINTIACLNNLLVVHIENIIVALDGSLKKEVELITLDEEIKEEIKEAKKYGKVYDSYSSGRTCLKEKMSDKTKKYSNYIFAIPDIATLVYRLLKDDRVPTKLKLIISGSVAYIAIPTDIIPSKIPFVGKIDEIAVAFFALNKILKEVPLEVILENWEGNNDIVVIIKAFIDYSLDFTNEENVEVVYNIIESISKFNT